MDWVDRLREAVDATGKHSSVAIDAGVDPSALSDILRRVTDDPKLFTVVNVCRVCGVTVGWVLGEKGFELGAADYEFLGTLAEWTNQRSGMTSPACDSRLRRSSILFVRKTRNPVAANRRIVVCRIDGTFAVKRLSVEEGRITLVSENKKDPPIVINEDAERYLQIGIVVGLARDLVKM